jgi:hypothetical protein
LRSATPTQFGDDIQKYLTYIRDNLHLITTADGSNGTHNNLLTYIFTSLSTMTITLFKEDTQKLHVQYLEANENDLTTAKLVKIANDKIQVLQYWFMGMYP